MCIRNHISVTLLPGKITLTFLQSILVTTQSVLHNLALRSISMKDRNSHSWFIYIDKILHEYDLQSFSDLETIHSCYCLADLQDQARLKSSLRVLCLDRCWIGKPHPVWQNIHTNLDIRCATLKAKIMYDMCTFFNPTASTNTKQILAADYVEMG